MTGGSGPIDSAALHPKIEASSPRVLKAGDQIVFSLSVRRNEWCTILATEELQRYLREKRLHKYRLFMIRVSMPLWYLHPTDRFHDTDRDEKNLFLFVHAKQMVTDSLDCTKPN
jgi:hypothetical protein